MEVWINWQINGIGGRDQEKTYTQASNVGIGLESRARVTIPKMLCTIPLVVRDVVVDTCVIGVALIPPTADKVRVRVHSIARRVFCFVLSGVGRKVKL